MRSTTCDSGIQNFRKFSEHGIRSGCDDALDYFVADGKKRYENDIYGRTTTHMTPTRFTTWPAEIARIEAEMTVIAKKKASRPCLDRASVKTNPKYIPTSSEQILDDFRHYIRRWSRNFQSVYATPKSPVTVERYGVPVCGATHYMIGTPDGSGQGGGRRDVRLRAPFADRRRGDCVSRSIPDTTCSYQCSSSSRDCRSSGYMDSALMRTPKVALYAEQLGKESAFYQDPASDFGDCLRNFSAVRLVVDTGIHSKDGVASRW